MPPPKHDAFLDVAFDEVCTTAHESGGNENAAAVAMLIRLRTPEAWTTTPGFTQRSRLGDIVSGRGTRDALRRLLDDVNVLSVEASRDTGVLHECASSVPFIKAARVHARTPWEKGDQAIVALVDSGIDVLHKAFLDDQGNSRVWEIWDQADPTGPTPASKYPALSGLTYGSLHDHTQIEGYVEANSVPARLGRDPNMHGTHVASIAAGRPTTHFAGGVAPAAKLVVVIPQLRALPTDRYSIGYSSSHAEALDYINAVASALDLPVAVNVSLGMNAGAHDGSSLLEAAFDAFAGGGRRPGRVVVKSAGNERGQDGHAQLSLTSLGADTLMWDSSSHSRNEDVFELWFQASDAFHFCLVDPTGFASPWVNWASPTQSGVLPSGNRYDLVYTRYHHDNGDSQLLVVVRRGTSPSWSVNKGRWKLEIKADQVRSAGVVQAWVERDNTRPVKFANHQNEEMTLTIPATASSVITVGAVNSSFPVANTSSSSYGPTRDKRNKPDLVAPGTAIQAARASTAEDVEAMTGTSMAAPHVTGAVALLLSRQRKAPGVPLANAAQIRAALTHLSQNFNGFWTPSNGYGVLDADSLFGAFE